MDILKFSAVYQLFAGFSFATVGIKALQNLYATYYNTAASSYFISTAKFQEIYSRVRPNFDNTLLSKESSDTNFIQQISILTTVHSRIRSKGQEKKHVKKLAATLSYFSAAFYLSVLILSGFDSNQHSLFSDDNKMALLSYFEIFFFGLNILFFALSLKSEKFKQYIREITIKRTFCFFMSIFLISLLICWISNQYEVYFFSLYPIITILLSFTIVLYPFWTIMFRYKVYLKTRIKHCNNYTATLEKVLENNKHWFKAEHDSWNITTEE